MKQVAELALRVTSLNSNVKALKDFLDTAHQLQTAKVKLDDRAEGIVTVESEKLMQRVIDSIVDLLSIWGYKIVKA